MAAAYQQTKDKFGLINGVRRLSDGAFIPEAGGNRDWQEYQKWVGDGNQPDPADA